MRGCEHAVDPRSKRRLEPLIRSRPSTTRFCFRHLIGLIADSAGSGVDGSGHLPAASSAFFRFPEGAVALPGSGEAAPGGGPVANQACRSIRAPHPITGRRLRRAGG